MPSKEVFISISDVKNYKKCRQLWQFSSGIRGNWGHRATNKNLFAGTGAHAALEAYYASTPRTQAVLVNAWDAWLQESLKDVDTSYMAEGMVDKMLEELVIVKTAIINYHDWAKDTDKFDVIQPEIPFDLPLPLWPGYRVHFIGRADGWVQGHDGKFWLLEHKTTSVLPDTDTLFLDEQAIGYQWATWNDPRFAGRQPVGTLYTFIVKDIPEVPRVLKNGQLSQAVNIKTTYEVYMDTLSKAGLDPAPYAETLQRLKARENLFYRRIAIKRQPRAMYVFGAHFVATVSEMLEPNIPIYPNPSWYTCKWCSFKTPCSMVQNGLSPNPILEYEFVQRTHDYPTEETDDKGA